MEEKMLAIVNHINERLGNLKELGKTYSEEKINALALKLLSTNKSLDEIKTLIDNKFSNEVRKINHNNHLSTLKEYYLASIDKLKKGNNCYLLSYEEGVKVLEQAYLKEDRVIDESLKEVTLNKSLVASLKKNDVSNDYELIISDIAYLLNVNYAKTFRVFDENMNPNGILSVSAVNKNERFLTFEEALRFVKEESTSFNLRTELEDYHDKKIKHGLKVAKSNEDYISNLEYVFKLFRALPDIKKENIENLKKEYLNMKVFEILTNSLNNNLNNIGLIVNKEKIKYTYRLAPSYNKCTVSIPSITKSQTICNFYIVEKKVLLATIVNNYYDYVKELVNLIVDNKNTLVPICNQVIQEHLDFKEYSNYLEIIKNNIVMIDTVVREKKISTPDTEEDLFTYDDNNILYSNRITPFVDNYIEGDISDDKHNNLALIIMVLITLVVTLGIIILAIIAISKLV